MNYKMEIAYEGTRYRGWQRLKNTDMTIQGKIEAVLSRFLNVATEINGASRTDSGVHALHQIANFKSEQVIDRLELITYMNQYLPEDICIKSIETVSEAYHARFGAKKKIYLYRIWKASYPPVFERKFVTQYHGVPLDIGEMKSAATFLEGEYNFKGFCTDKTKKSTVRRIDAITFSESDEEIKIFVEGNGFLHNMVRIIVGTLIEVGAGKRTAESVKRILETGDRRIAGETAPPQGLTLYKIGQGSI
ncbi:tRNA pseudouridine(38-40) synthase TruA [Fusibacter ferrireducens]|uniref:tRNA pseudouridine synthase A n=1 Tax=Fusibacter ferrireducens TaxID=2785058 RepID=A0ABR9ZRC3_9FIRM|nr:tRNA pseudouridine(38-40) synthase TruA [Fusibacter ferrireducens]MBF4693010.1 tRNA pseudouridine(38-40) synthase TruA [Fusibacter ferrireducens]